MDSVFVERKDIDQVVGYLNHGQVVAFPTETVFGLGIRFNDLKALNQLYQLKKRNKNKAITLMVSSIQEIESFAYASTQARKIMEAFMPGKITIILKKKEAIDKRYTSNLDTIGIRIPDDAFVLALLQKAGPMLVTSANLSGEQDLLTDEEVYEAFKEEELMIVRGKAGSSLPSSVVDASKEEIVILRQGEITLKEIMEVIK